MTADPADTPVPDRRGCWCSMSPEWPDAATRGPSPAGQTSMMPRRLRVWRLADGTVLTCAGSAWVVFAAPGDEHPYDPDTDAAAETQRCRSCDGGIAVTPQLYQRFKETVVADWPTGAEFRITVGEVRAWLDAVNEDGPRG